MNDRRCQDSVSRPAPITILCDGVPVEAYPGETLAAVLLAAGTRRFRDDRSGQARGPFCNMGTCSECIVWLRSGPEAPWHRRRACLIAAAARMQLQTGEPGDEG